MPTKIKENFRPTGKTYNNLRIHGAIPEFVDWELPQMITYFTETKDKRQSWQMTCQVWMRRAFKGKAGRDWENERDKSRMYRNQIAAVRVELKGDILTRTPITIKEFYKDPPPLTAEQRSIQKFKLLAEQIKS